MRHETTRRLPVTLPPIHHETIGSYLHRLAVANNRPARKLASLLGPLPSGFTPASDTTAPVGRPCRVSHRGDTPEPPRRGQRALGVERRECALSKNGAMKQGLVELPICLSSCGDLAL